MTAKRKLIAGVKVKKCKLFRDERGFLTEIIKEGEVPFFQIKQTVLSQVNPGIIKAFHFHKKQSDIWFVVKGNIKVVLYDLRKKSPTYKQTNVLFMGEDKYLVLLIPPNVAHGYQVLGKKPALVVYHLNTAYNPKNPDEGRIPFDNPDIGFDWKKQN